MAGHSKVATSAHSNCCNCPARISSNVRKNRIGQRKFLPLYRAFTGDYSNQLDLNQLICKKCHLLVRNAAKKNQLRSETTESQMMDSTPENPSIKLQSGNGNS